MTIIPETASAQQVQSPDSAIFNPADVRISLLTAMPGAEIFELYGHEGLRVIMPDGRDIVYNYGVFDFNAPGFVARFVRGETDYMLAPYPYSYFIAEYEQRGSQVIEQEIDLTPQQKLRLLLLLDENARPENRIYRYKYLTDNCATRILDKLDEATGNDIVYPTASNYETWRSQMQEFNDRYPWYQFGIDLALGAPLDNETDGRQEMFMPVTMQHTIGGARFSDGRPLVKETRTVYQGRGDVREQPTPWYITPVFIFWIVATYTVLCILGRWNNVLRISAALWLALCGIAGLVIWYLIFISVHEATSPNILGLWAGPQCFVAAWIVLTHRCRKWMLWYMRIYALAVASVMVLSLTGVQHINTAMWPILLTTILFTLDKDIDGKYLRLKK